MNQVAAYLGVASFDLLMHPADASALKQLRIAAGQIAAVQIAADSDKAATLQKLKTVF